MICMIFGYKKSMAADVNVQKNDELTLDIEKLVYGGEGIAHHESQVCFVNSVIPGEKVVATVDRMKRSYVLTSLHEIVAPSVHRILPLCPIVNDCGGCQWQHIAYTHQLYWKTRILEESLERIAGLRDTVIKPPIASPAEFYYRSKATLRVRSKPDSAIGYFKGKTHGLVPVRKCALLAPSLNEALTTCWALLEENHDMFKGVSVLEMMFIHESNRTILSLKNKDVRKTANYLFEPDSRQLRPYKGNTLEKVNNLRFNRVTEIFYQVNHQQNHQMVNLVSEYFLSLKKSTILDLYCGCGNFSLFLAKAGAEVDGVDSNKRAIKEAVYNAKINGIEGCRFIKADINKLGEKVIKSSYAGILLNPPRSGCSKNIIRRIVDANPSVIVYVSCNPATLARDLSALVSSGYKVEEVQPVDMFPQTYHIEAIVKLTKNTI